MPEKKKRERVVAEITVAHLLQFAKEAGLPLTQEDAIAFLNRNGHAYAMWKHMMLAAEEFIKTDLQQKTFMPTPGRVAGRSGISL